MEYLIWVALVVLIGVVIIWKYKGGNMTKEEQEAEYESLGARSSTFLSRTSEKEDTAYNDIPNLPRTRGPVPPMPKVKPTRQAPPSPPPMRSLGGSRSASSSSYVAESVPVQQDNGMGLLTTVVLMDALGVFDSNEPARETPPPVPTDPIPEPRNEPVTATTTDYSSSRDDTSWSSNDRSDSGWSSSSSDSSSYDSSSSSSSSDSSNW